jgi:hypothetical protein
VEGAPSFSRALVGEEEVLGVSEEEVEQLADAFRNVQ